MRRNIASRAPSDRTNCSWRSRMRRSSLGARKPDWRKSYLRIDSGLHRVVVPLNVSTATSPVPAAGGVSDGGTGGFMSRLLDGKLRQVHFLHQRFAEDRVEAG